MSQQPAVDEPATPSRRERKRERTRAAIYEAAMELFETRPYAEVTVEDICARAEIGRATFFRFYGAKAALLLEFNRRLADRARDAIDAQGLDSAPDQLRTVASVIAEAWATSSEAMRAMAFEMLNRPETPVGGESLHPELIALVADVIRDGHTHGELRGKELGPEFLGVVVVTTLAGCVASWFDTPDSDLHTAADRTIDLLLRGLQTEPA